MYHVYGVFRCLGCLRGAIILIFDTLLHWHLSFISAPMWLLQLIGHRMIFSNRSQTDTMIVQPLQTALIFLPTGEFKECTILFSDVVTFTNICAQCEPIQIVLMLNSMYLRFDRLTTVHDVYKVGTDQKRLQKFLLLFLLFVLLFVLFLNVLKSSLPQHDCWLNHKILLICSVHTSWKTGKSGNYWTGINFCHRLKSLSTMLIPEWLFFHTSLSPSFLKCLSNMNNLPNSSIWASMGPK